MRYEGVEEGDVIAMVGSKDNFVQTGFNNLLFFPGNENSYGLNGKSGSSSVSYYHEEYNKTTSGSHVYDYIYHYTAPGWDSDPEWITNSDWLTYKESIPKPNIPEEDFEEGDMYLALADCKYHTRINPSGETEYQLYYGVWHIYHENMPYTRTETDSCTTTTYNYTETIQQLKASSPYTLGNIPSFNFFTSDVGTSFMNYINNERNHNLQSILDGNKGVSVITRDDINSFLNSYNGTSDTDYWKKRNPDDTLDTHEEHTIFTLRNIREGNGDYWEPRRSLSIFPFGESDTTLNPKGTLAKIEAIFN